MRSALSQIPPLTTIAAALLAASLAGCQPAQDSHPVPSVSQIGAGLKCAPGDHGFTDPQVGWGFCYPGTWKYEEKSQSSQSPSPVELDLTFDITDVPCTPPAPGASGSPTCAGNAGLFGFMIISTFERGDATSLDAWIQANMKPVPETLPIKWGNALEAAQLADGRRIALTPHQVVVMDLRSGTLNLESVMAPRLDTWHFTV